MLTPFVGVTVPTHHYETSGHTATGRDFYELLVGVNAGRQLGPVLPNVYIQGRYSFAILKHFGGGGYRDRILVEVFARVKDF